MFSKLSFQESEGRFACAVPSKVSSVEMAQRISNRGEFLHGGAHEVESAHEYIRLEVIDDVDNTAVGTAAEEYLFVVFLNEEVDFVAEIIWQPDSSLFSAHAAVRRRIRLRNRARSMQGDAGG